MAGPRTYHKRASSTRAVFSQPEDRTTSTSMWRRATWGGQESEWAEAGNMSASPAGAGGAVAAVVAVVAALGSVGR